VVYNIYFLLHCALRYEDAASEMTPAGVLHPPPNSA
jgi:hypothetical protein